MRGQFHDVINKLNHTFIDLPDLIDASEEEIEAQPVYTQSVYALEAPSSCHVSQQQQQQHHQVQQPAEQSSTAVAGSYWQQLQQFNAAHQPLGQIPGLAPAAGSLGASLSGAMQQHQHQHGPQQQQGQHSLHHVSSAQQQQQQRTGQQIGAQQAPQDRNNVAVHDDSSMDEG